MPARRRFLCGIVLAGLGLYWLAGGAAEDVSGDAWDRPDFAVSTISVDRGDGSLLTYRVELATTPRQHAYGLMHVRQMEADAGMLFVFDGMAIRSFWMKNTLISLDMLFFDDEGRLVSAVEEATPGSLVSRRSEGPARYVLEWTGGSMQAHGIRPGARLRFPLGD
ncbi:MAG: DUF192 domain-containing protein [Pseudomonadota bacterium]|nr:DUF192 domain-containing protein [Pseudomonadota bacterium]